MSLPPVDACENSFSAYESKVVRALDIHAGLIARVNEKATFFQRAESLIDRATRKNDLERVQRMEECKKILSSQIDELKGKIQQIERLVNMAFGQSLNDRMPLIDPS